MVFTARFRRAFAFGLLGHCTRGRRSSWRIGRLVKQCH
jgi:hypothetical protein